MPSSRAGRWTGRERAFLDGARAGAPIGSPRSIAHGDGAGGSGKGGDECVIHPNSLFKRSFDLLTVVFVFVNIWNQHRLIMENHWTHVTPLQAFLQFWFILDIVVSFNTGYVDEHGAEVMDRQRVWDNYLKKWLLLDLLGTAPVEYLVELPPKMPRAVKWYRIVTRHVPHWVGKLGGLRESLKIRRQVRAYGFGFVKVIKGSVAYWRFAKFMRVFAVTKIVRQTHAFANLWRSFHMATVKTTANVGRQLTKTWTDVRRRSNLMFGPGGRASRLRRSLTHSAVDDAKAAAALVLDDDEDDDQALSPGRGSYGSRGSRGSHSSHGSRGLDSGVSMSW